MAAAARHAKRFNTIVTFVYVRGVVWIWYSFGMSNFYRINTDTEADRSHSFVRLRHTQRHWRCVRTSETKQVISHEKLSDRISVCVCVWRSSRCSLNLIVDTMEATQHTLPWTPHASCWKWLCLYATASTHTEKKMTRLIVAVSWERKANDTRKSHFKESLETKKPQHGTTKFKSAHTTSSIWTL